MLQVIILAAGCGERWNIHLNAPKQRIPIPIGGEPLLHRTIHLLRHHFNQLVVETLFDAITRTSPWTRKIVRHLSPFGGVSAG